MNRKDFLHSSLSNRTNSTDESKDHAGSNILFDNKIWIVVHQDGTVFYSNEKCKSELNLFEGDSFSKLNSEPNLIAILENLKKYNYNNFVFETLIDSGLSAVVYNVELERIIIEKEVYYILIFNSFDDKKDIQSAPCA